ncbi:MAG: HNH endonuclease signature motif containing protein [Cyanobacteriota bacterium]|nr:HNH endonuclease signature motif containing protein [Cyanobacteriota bacterium]
MSEENLEERSRPNRDRWIEKTYYGFVSRSQANKQYYRIILETLWPSGCWIPTPMVAMQDIRNAIETFRGKPYTDVARRIRELQGEEGIVGLKRIGSGSGTKYQLVSLDIKPKRIPRIALKDKTWQKILQKYQNCCAVCDREITKNNAQQDHKIPRLRGGGNEEENWQPLCKECNNFKSTACRGCDLDCQDCPWAFPERLAPIKLSSSNIQKVRKMAGDRKCTPSHLLNEIIDRYFKN